MTDREILLLTHGKARPGDPDAARELKSRAKRQAQKLGAWMGAAGLRPDVTLASPAQRALVSAEKALKAGGWTAQGIETDPRLYKGPVADHLAALAAHPVPRVLCAGHPGAMSRLLQHLVPNGPKLGRGALARLILAPHGPGDLLDPADTVRLDQIVMADDLPDSFPWPGSAERRDRPAYYYTQSAALPYRLQNGAPEVLLITSSSGLKWGIPKGICEPGLSPQDSAAQEALEEAGLTGHVQPEALGTYPVEKWGATCHVTVYPMQVTAMDPDTRWDENHRQRIWLPRAEAARQVTSLQLARLIRAWQPVPAT